MDLIKQLLLLKEEDSTGEFYVLGYWGNPYSSSDKEYYWSGPFYDRIDASDFGKAKQKRGQPKRFTNWSKGANKIFTDVDGFVKAARKVGLNPKIAASESSMALMALLATHKAQLTGSVLQITAHIDTKSFKEYGFEWFLEQSKITALHSDPDTQKLLELKVKAKEYVKLGKVIDDFMVDVLEKYPDLKDIKVRDTAIKPHDFKFAEAFKDHIEEGSNSGYFKLFFR